MSTVKATEKATEKARVPAYIRKVLLIWATFFNWVGSPKLYETIDSRRTMLAYQGNKHRVRTLDGFQEKGKGKANPSLQAFLRNALLPFSTAMANDGEIVRLFDSLGNETSRFFLSNRGMYQGMYGVSGKVRLAIETLNPNLPYQWVQQGSKNYFFSPCFDGLYAYLTSLKP